MRGRGGGGGEGQQPQGRGGWGGGGGKGPSRSSRRPPTLDRNGLPTNSPDAIPWTTATDAINDWGAGWAGG